MKNRIILHIDMDAFFPAIEERENPQFRGMPIIVGADPKSGQGRGVVSGASYSARKFGIRSGMPISKAFEFCPTAVFLPVNMELYTKVSERVMRIIKRYSPKWEIAGLDEAYLDLSFLIIENCSQNQRSLVLETIYLVARDLAKKLKREILEKEKLTSTIGIGPNKLIAKMAANKAKPDGLLIIKPNQAKSFLEPLDIEEIPGIGPKTGMRIAQSLSLRSRRYAAAPIRIKDLKKLSKKELVELLRKAGESIYQKARGIDAGEVVSEEIIKSIGKEHTFEKDTRDPEIIFNTFEKIIEDLHQELLENNFSFRTISVICRFQGFETHTKSKTLLKTTNGLEILRKEAKKLLLKFILENPKLIRLVGVKVSSLDLCG